MEVETQEKWLFLSLNFGDIMRKPRIDGKSMNTILVHGSQIQSNTLSSSYWIQQSEADW